MAGRTRSLLGPELLWLLLSITATALAAWNDPPTVERSRQLAVVALVIPVAGVVLSFVPFAWMHARWWLLARINVAALIGIFFVATKICGAIRYDGHEPGSGTAWMLITGLSVSLLILFSAITLIILLTSPRHRRAIEA
jgi:hypothetical protein